ncbi:MAG: hypothetical protein GX596_11655 [Propionibacterium sp.]|nr:hypothetical protein [Propionibacterium sp.]
MRDLASTIADATHALRATTGAQWALRALTLAAAAGAAALCWVWFPFGYAPAMLGLVVVLGLASVVRPDSLAPVLTIAAVLLWWIVGGGEATWWRPVVVALLVAVFHFGIALAAAAPPWSHGDAGVLRRWLASSGTYLGLTALGLGVVVGAASLGGGGMTWVVAGALTLLAAAVVVARSLRE